jgi:drug/metabolite transporter (DMT)-like permease
MSIQNVLTAALFKRDDAGRTLVFPNGAVGRGYFVPDAATEQKIRRTITWGVIGSSLFGIIGMQIIVAFYGDIFTWSSTPWTIALTALAAYSVGYRVVTKRLVRGMKPAEQRMGVTEALKKQAEAMPRWYLMFMAIIAALMIGGSAFWMVVGLSMMKYLLGLVGIVLFGAIMMQAIYGLSHRRSQP